jgi:hypothetical protein
MSTDSTLLLWLRDLQPGPPILQSAWNNLKLPYQIPSRSTILGVLPCQRLHISITGDSPRIYHSFSSPAAIRDREIRWQEGSTIQLALRKPLSHSRLAPGTKLKENLSFLLWRCIGLVAPKNLRDLVQIRKCPRAIRLQPYGERGQRTYFYVIINNSAAEDLKSPSAAALDTLLLWRHA